MQQFSVSFTSIFLQKLVRILFFLLISPLKIVNSEEATIVYPTVQESRVNDTPEKTTKVVVRLLDWIIELEENVLLDPGVSSQWFLDENSQLESANVHQCDYRRGVVRGLESFSVVALAICASPFSVTGFVSIPEIAGTYFLEPLDDDSTGAHVLYRAKFSYRSKRNDEDVPASEGGRNFYDLTGDTVEIYSTDEDIYDIYESSDIHTESTNYTNDLGSNNNSASSNPWPETSSAFTEEFGYFYDSAWNIDVSHNRGRSSLFERRTTQTRWLKIAVAVDHTLIHFHGKNRVEQYVLALMNIVSAIYRDSSLDADLQMIVTRLLFYEHKRQSTVRPGNARKSLENVNVWNRRLHVSLAPGEVHHDVAVWLTRADIGGPSGYAPVGGVCDPRRSCALNRDEGLTSAFIIAHEMAHLLGLSHDGDVKSGNDCGDEAQDGSVMAPMVSATFHKFTWSECSREEFRMKVAKWTCLKDSPPGMGEITLNATIDAVFTMDEQCRMEFGEGFQLCKAFDIVEPCSHLWCGHIRTPLVCKTKKGPPLEGTECGYNSWCINGYCEPVDARHFDVLPPVQHNPRDGNWSQWSPWGPCSRTCGKSVRFRTRTCDNPAPTDGGKQCEGFSEEWKLCEELETCPEPLIDFRAQQCLNVARYLSMSDRKTNLTWQPYESEKDSEKCKLICISRETRELHFTGENLIDGSSCSYENTKDVCVQGDCQTLGCDGKINSSKVDDLCGVCGGNNSQCIRTLKFFSKKLKKEISRIAVLPRLSRNVVVEANLTANFVEEPTAAFLLKSRIKKKYSVPIPDDMHWDIIEGAKFYYTKTENRHKLWTKGPLLVEMVVLLYVSKSEVGAGLEASVLSNYYVKKGEISSVRFRWIVGGWSPCSASCGGGRRKRTVACWDTEAGRITRRKFCSLVHKPEPIYQTCNKFGCAFRWIPGEWEPCTVTCGSYGLQSRELYCVPQDSIANETSSLANVMVSPNKCMGPRQEILRSCNRLPCISYWMFGDWSQCSVTCGSGVSTRSAHCPPPEDESFYSCGRHPQIQRKSCRGLYTGHKFCKKDKKRRCTGDLSKYCSVTLLHKYCKLGGFRKLCCKSCHDRIFPFST